MNEQETVAIMAVLETAYPQYYKGQTTEQRRAAISLWHEMLADEETMLVVSAVKAFIATDVKGFPPSIGQVKQNIAGLKRRASGNVLTSAEAWNLVVKAVGRYGHFSADEAFNSFPPVVKRIVGSPGHFRDWCLSELSAFQTVIASNFQRAYNEIIKSDEEYELLPSSVKSVVETLAEQSEDRIKFLE